MFPSPFLQAVAEVPETGLRRSLTHLQAAEFLYETRLFPGLEYTFKHALTYQVAYESLLQERRRELHTRIMEALEALTGERLSEQVERLAHHALRGEVWDKALTYFQQAGDKATARSAHIEAVSHLTTALDLLKNLPDGPQRVRQELAVQTTLGAALMATKGYAAPEVEQAYARARALCQQVEETPEVCRVLVGLHMFHRQRGELQTSYEVRHHLLTLAHNVEALQFLLVAQQALGTTLYFMGEFVQARVHLEQGITLYDPRRHHSQAIVYGQDPGVICLSTLARALWALGYPDQARQRLQESLTLARQLSHPVSLSFALYFAAVVYHYLQQVQVTQEHAEALMALSAEQGRGTAGIAPMRQSVAAYGTTGADLGRSSYLALLAEAYGKEGQAEEGLAVRAEALAVVDEHGIHFNEAKLYGLKGELLLRHLTARGSQLMASAEPVTLPEVELPVLTEAETYFRHALDTASRQHAKSLELRAAMSLSRLWQRQGKRAEARDLLAPIYSWFSEGFDTADLQEAKALLAALA